MSNESLIKSIYIVVAVFLLQGNLAFAQPSYSTFIKFRLLDENGEPVSMHHFNQEYSIVNSFGTVIKADSNLSATNYLWYDHRSKYFTYHIVYTHREYFFALYHDDSLMQIAVPINETQPQKFLAIDIPFKPGEFLLDFDLDNRKTRKRLETLEDPVFVDQTFYVIHSADWDKLEQKFDQSEYAKSSIIFEHFLKNQRYADSLLIGNTFSALTGESCSDRLNGGCWNEEYTAMKFEKDSVLIYFNQTSHCLPEDTTTHQNHLLPKKYFWYADEDEILIPAFDQMELYLQTDGTLYGKDVQLERLYGKTKTYKFSILKPE